MEYVTSQKLKFNKKSVAKIIFVKLGWINDQFT